MKALPIVGIVVIALLVVAGAAYLLFFRGPDLSRYDELKNPRISHKDAARMIEVSFHGKPDRVLMQAFNLLFKTYYSLPGVKKGPGQPAPIARFKGLAGLPKDPVERAKTLAGFADTDWEGAVGLPVPEGIASLPAASVAEPFTIRLTTWEYGEVAEILHLGSYDTEPPTIARLEEHIKGQGYAISGEHEEEYLRGPGTPFAKPASYYTIIRYPVTRIR